MLNSRSICSKKKCEQKHNRLKGSFEYMLFSFEQEGTVPVLNIVEKK